MNQKIILIGLYNPTSPSIADALVPWASCPIGDALFSLMNECDPDFTRERYLESFERFCLWPSTELPAGPGSVRLLNREGRRLYKYCTRTPRVVVLFGSKTWAHVVRRTPPSWLESREKGGSTFWYMPAPNMRKRLFNARAMLTASAMMLLDLLDENAEAPA